MHFLLPARFRPFHNGHLDLIQHLLAQGRVTLLLGCADVLNLLNSFFTFEVKWMIRGALPDVGSDRLRIEHMGYIPDDAAYVTRVHEALPRNELSALVTGNDQVISAFQSRLQVRPLHIGAILSSVQSVSGTEVRSLLRSNDAKWRDLVPPATAAVIDAINGAERIRELEEYALRLSPSLTAQVEPIGTVHAAFGETAPTFDDDVATAVAARCGRHVVPCSFAGASPTRIGRGRTQHLQPVGCTIPSLTYRFALSD